MFGQLKSGAWADRVDFDPKGKRSDLYRNGQGNPKGRNYSTLDDDKSQAAIRFLIEMDKADTTNRMREFTTRSNSQ